jgi:prevent-host-death family protein
MRYITEVEAMAVQVNIAEAKAKLSSLLARTLAGEEIVIARAGKPLARLVPVKQPTRRKPGVWRHWKISNEALLEPMDPEDLDAAEGKYTDDFGITLPGCSEV